MNSLITPEIMLEIQERSAIGHSLRDIKEWLLKEKQISYSRVSISRVINKQRAMRKELTEEIMRPILAEKINNDLEILDAMIEECKATISMAKVKGDQRLKLGAMDRMDKFLRLSFKVKGIETEDTKDQAVETDYNEIITRFDWKNKDEE